MTVNITRWRNGNKPLSQTWTEFVGRMMKHDETPEDIYRKFDEFFCSGRWPIG